MDNAINFKDIIGRSAEITFTDFSDVCIPAKVDTGAYRSAVHASDIYVDEDGALHFKLLGDHSVCQGISFEVAMDDYQMVDIENSFGDHEDRYEVELRIKIGKREFVTPFTLANRQKKVFPILLGRKFLRKRFLVDVDKSDIDRKKLKELHEINLPQDEEQEYNDK